MSNYTLELFRLFLERNPIGLPTQLKVQAQAEYKRFEQQEIMPEQVEAMMIKYGMEAWPYMQADFTFYEKYGQKKEEELMVKNFSPQLQSKWKEFISQGGSMRDYHNGDTFEQYFTPEENMQIEQALMEARDEVRRELEGLALSEKRDEYDGLIEKYKQEQEQIISKMKELEELKQKGNKWDDEIDEALYYLRKGFAELEERPSIEKVQGTIDLYLGQIEAGNA